MTSKCRFHFLYPNLPNLFYYLLFASLLYSKFTYRSSVVLHPLLSYISYFFSFVSSPLSSSYSSPGINFQRKHLAINFTLQKFLPFAISPRSVYNTAMPMLSARRECVEYSSTWNCPQWVLQACYSVISAWTRPTGLQTYTRKHTAKRNVQTTVNPRQSGSPIVRVEKWQILFTVE
jgi:hypothetical protein